MPVWVWLNPPAVVVGEAAVVAVVPPTAPP